jgi:N6-adenosine-specific RNA methylase IME4
LSKGGQLVKISQTDLAKFGDWYNKARTPLDKAQSIDEVKEIKNRAEAVRIYALKAGDKKLREDAAEVGLRADFLGKELAKKMREHGELAKQGNRKEYRKGTHVGTFLKDIGLSRKQSSKWHQLDPVTKAEFEQAIKKVREKDELTKAAVIREVVKVPARAAKQQKIADEAKAGGQALPTGTLFPVILCDCPWEYDFSETQARMLENHYPPQTLDYLCAGIFDEPDGTQRDIRTLFAEDAVIFFWATAPKLREGLRVLKSWGFQYKTQAVWDKEKIGMGYWFRGQHEILCVGTQGNIPVPLEGDRVSSVIREARTSHSKKPIRVYEIIEKYYPHLPKLELFSRSDRPGWTAWGDQLNMAALTNESEQAPVRTQ